MRRRQVLQLGAALTTLPLTGCGAGEPPPPPAPATPPPATSSDKAAVARPDPSATASTDAPAHDDKGTDTPSAPPKDEPPKTNFTSVNTGSFTFS